MLLVFPDIVYTLDLNTNNWTRQNQDLSREVARYLHSGTIKLNTFYIHCLLIVASQLSS